MNTSILQTERLILRKFNENDFEAIFQIYSDQEVNTFLPWYPLTSLKEAKIFYEEHFSQARGYHYAICLKKDNIPIGYINVSMEDSHDFGYGLLKSFWHQSIVTEACLAVIEQLRQDHIPYITATHDIHNPRSGQVMKRLGMKYQYSYEEQWLPKNILVTFRMYQLNLDSHDERVYQKYWQLTDVHYVENEALF